MQPGPSKASEQRVSPNLFPDQQPFPNHGLHHDSSSPPAGDLVQDEVRRRGEREDVRGSVATRSPAWDSAAGSAAWQPASGRDLTVGVVNVEDRDGNALKPNDDDDLNRVAPGLDASGDASSRQGPILASDDSSLARLPNEVLTHILSHLPPADLFKISAVSHHFHELVTAPYAWKTGFCRFFQGHDAIPFSQRGLLDRSGRGSERSERRYFTRLTEYPTWRNEYLLRVRLLRCLARGKPASELSRLGSNTGGRHSHSAVVMYDSRLTSAITHLHANFDTAVGKKALQFIHGEAEYGGSSVSEPLSGKGSRWALSDPLVLPQFADEYPGESQWGLGDGQITGVPNVMDVSQLHGVVLGAGLPAGPLCFRPRGEQTSRRLALPIALSDQKAGIPQVVASGESICSVWIAKFSAIPSLSSGLVGMLSGSSTGIVSCYTLGTDGLRTQRFMPGTLTARWAVCPGVPIVGFAVDEQYSIKRVTQNRIWAVAANALGEVYYLTKFPQRPRLDTAPRVDAESIEKIAWATGRSVYWKLAEPSRRQARHDPFRSSDIDGSYSPRSSWSGMCLNPSQLEAETREIDTFLQLKPRYFRRACYGWDMRRRLLVDFAGDDGSYAGENIVIIECGLDEDAVARVQRYTRFKMTEPSKDLAFERRSYQAQSQTIASSSASETSVTDYEASTTSSASITSSTTLSQASQDQHAVEDWRCSTLRLPNQKSSQITTVAIDESIYARLTMSEDPAMAYETVQNHSPPLPSVIREVPGQRARFVAVGTSTGDIYLWDCRASMPATASLVNDVDVVRVIHTDSPQISCIGLTALYVLSGGNDGLVQMWDPLASRNLPVRTLNSRFSSRARRRLAQAEDTEAGVGTNMFAAGAVCLDPDPRRLRGMVSLGTHLRFWSYSSSAADRTKGNKRRARRSGRLSNSGSHSEHAVTQKSGNLKAYISSEWQELNEERRERQRETRRLAGRFGVDLLGPDASEEEMIAYAAMLSEESLAEQQKRTSDSSSPVSSIDSTEFSSVSSSGAATPIASHATVAINPDAQLKTDTELDADIARAIRLSLGADEFPTPAEPLEGFGTVEYDVPIQFAKQRRVSPPSQPRPRFGSSITSSVGSSQPASGSKAATEESDLELAIQLSLIGGQNEASSLATRADDEFPALPPNSGTGKSKGKGRAP